MFKGSDKRIFKSIGKIHGLRGMTVNERLYHANLFDDFDSALINDKPRARQILRWLRVDEPSI